MWSIAADMQRFATALQQAVGALGQGEELGAIPLDIGAQATRGQLSLIHI